MGRAKLYNELLEFNDPEHEALMGVWYVGQILKNQARRFFSEYLSSEMQFNIMILLKYSDHPLSQKELSDRLLVDKSNLTGVAGRMEAAGLLTRQPDPADSRAYQLKLTARGREILRKAEMPYRQRVREVMSGFSPDELATLVRFMERMQTALYKGEKNG